MHAAYDAQGLMVSCVCCRGGIEQLNNELTARSFAMNEEGGLLKVWLQSVWFSIGSAVKKTALRLQKGCAFCKSFHVHALLHQHIACMMHSAYHTMPEHCKPTYTLVHDVHSHATHAVWGKEFRLLSQVCHSHVMHYSCVRL